MCVRASERVNVLVRLLRLSSVSQGDDDVIVAPLPQHLPLKVQHLVLAAAEQDSHHFVRDLHVALEQPPERDAAPALPVLVGHVSDDPHHLLHLPVDVFLGPVAPLGRLGALFGSTVAGVAFAQALGHGEVVVELFAERVELLVLDVLLGPLLPAALDVIATGNLNLQRDDRLA